MAAIQTSLAALQRAIDAVDGSDAADYVENVKEAFEAVHSTLEDMADAISDLEAIAAADGKKKQAKK